MVRTKKQPDLPDLTTDWAFRAKFRVRAFGWNGSKLAIERLKQALTEIKAVRRHDPLRAADGAVLLLEGYGYELTRADLIEAYREAMTLAEQLDEQDQLMAWMQDAASLRTEAAGWLHGCLAPPRT